jgi:drug/metabolite transporter superfamily protein YnfA
LIVSLINAFRDIGNIELPEIPLLSALWDDWAEGERLTVRNLVALLIAFPTTIVCRICTKNPPSAMNEFQKLHQLLYPTGSRLTNLTDDSWFWSIVALGQKIAAWGLPFLSLLYIKGSLEDWVKDDNQPTSRFTEVFAVFGAIFTFPFDIANPSRPALVCRFIECGLNFCQVISLKDNYRDTRGSVQLLCLAVKGPFILVSVIWDLFCDKKEYPALDYTGVWFWEANRLIGYGTDIANSLTLQSKGDNPDASMFYIIGSVVVFVVGESTNIVNLTSSSNSASHYNGTVICLPS